MKFDLNGRVTPASTALASVFLAAIFVLAGGKDIDGPPYEPSEALETFELADGFQIEVFAAEPLIRDPVDMEIDEQGSVYVLEMPGYPLDTGGSGRILLLEDRDQDGFPDTSIVFADGLTLPTGILRWKDGLLVTDATDVLYLEDVDGDGRADRRDVVLTGFALSNPQHNMNNPLLGLDNAVYIANDGTIGTETYADLFGDEGTPIRFPDRPEVEPLGPNAGGRNVRFHPDTGELAAMSGWSQFGHDFDTWGRHFLVSNAHHQFVEVIASRYLERNPALPVRETVAFTPEHGNAARVYPITLDPEHQLLTDRGVFTAASGLKLYDGGTFPGAYDSVAFVAESVHNIVHADVITDAGTSFAARRLVEGREFLASTDSWFRPVNLHVGPEGALYVLDYYRKIVEHPEWLDDETIRSGELYAGSDRGRIYRIAPSGTPPANWTGRLRLAKSSPADLVSLLSHENRWWRMQAQRLLVDAQARDATDLLTELVRNGTPAGRVHALWTLEGTSALDDGTIRTALTDPTPGVRENAVRLAERHGAARFESKLAGMADDADPKVRLQVLLTLGDLSTDPAREARRRLLRRDLDDSWVQIAALTAGVPPDVAVLRQALRDVSGTSAGSRYVEQVAALIAASGDTSDVTEVLTEALADGRRAVLRGLARGLSRRRGSDVQLETSELVAAAFATPDAELREAVLGLLRHAGEVGDDTVRRAMAIAADPAEDADRRAHMLMIVRMGNAADYNDDLKALIAARPAPAIEEEAVRAFARDGDHGTMAFLLAHFGQLSLAAREATLDALMRQTWRVEMLLDAVEQGDISPYSLGWNRRVVLMRDREGAVQRRARTLLRASDISREDLLRRYEPAVASAGDPEEGRAVYYAACARCHAFDGVGAAFGPDLGTVAHWSKRALLEAILVPEKAVADGYALWRITRRDGRMLSGVLQAETSSAVTLVQEGGREVVLSRNEIEAMDRIEGSAMPTGLEEQIDPSEMTDLLAFLRREG